MRTASDRSINTKENAVALHLKITCIKASYTAIGVSDIIRNVRKHATHAVNGNLIEVLSTEVNLGYFKVPTAA